MRKKLLTIAIVLIFAVCLSTVSFAAPIKPVADPWDNPENLEIDGATYFTRNDAGYVVAWETPECSVDGKYMLLNNDTEVVIEYRVAYMESVPWGHVTVESEPDKDGNTQSFSGWILMSDLVDAEGVPAAVIPPKVPDHPMILNPLPTSTPEPEETPEPTPEATEQLPERPQQAITVSNTYNNAIVYTSVVIAVIALAMVVYVLIKHKALNKNGE